MAEQRQITQATSIPSVAERPTVDELPDEVQPRLGFWQRPATLLIAPYAISIALHVAVAAGLWASLPPRASARPDDSADPIIVPDTLIVEGAKVGGMPRLELESGSGNVRDLKIQTVAEAPPMDVASRAPGTALAAGAGESMLGVAAVGPATRTLGGELAPGALGAGGPPAAAAPDASFMGVSGNALRIAYVCDASATMMTSIGYLRQELKRSIEQLKPVQQFNVIVFRDDRVVCFNEHELVIANDENKRKAFAFADALREHGETHPIPAIEEAFRQKPQLVFVLTDGFESADDLAAVRQAFVRLNPDKRVKVNTLLIPSRPDKELEQLLRDIAADNGGLFKSLSVSR